METERSYRGLNYAKSVITAATACLGLLSNPGKIIENIKGLKNITQATKTIPGGNVDMSQATPFIIEAYSASVMLTVLFNVISTALTCIDYLSWNMGYVVAQLAALVFSTALSLAISGLIIMVLSKYHDRWSNTAYTLLAILGIVGVVCYVLGVLFGVLGSILSMFVSGILKGIVNLASSLLTPVMYASLVGSILRGYPVSSNSDNWNSQQNPNNGYYGDDGQWRADGDWSRPGDANNGNYDVTAQFNERNTANPNNQYSYQDRSNQWGNLQYNQPPQRPQQPQRSQPQRPQPPRPQPQRPQQPIRPQQPQRPQTPQRPQAPQRPQTPQRPQQPQQPQWDDRDDFGNNWGGNQSGFSDTDWSNSGFDGL